MNAERVSRVTIRIPLTLLAAVVLLSISSCRQTIPLAPPITSNSASDYFWTGSPYNPTYLVSQLPDTAQADQLNLRTAADTMLMTDGVGSRPRMRFRISNQSVTISGYVSNAIFPVYPGTTIMNPVGAVFAPFKVSIQSLLYLPSKRTLFAGTDSDGIWYIPRGGRGWTKAPGSDHATITALTVTEKGVIYGLSPDSIYFSIDSGQTFKSVPDIRKPHVAMTTSGSTLYIGGGDIERIDQPGAVPSLFSPVLPYNSTNSLRALAISQNSLIAGVISSSSTSKLFSIPFGASKWSSPALTVQTSHDVHALIALHSWIFAGTLGGEVIISEDTGHTWRSFFSGSGPSYFSAFAIGETALFAGSSNGEVIQSLPPDTLSVRYVTNLGSPIRSMATLGPDSLVVACDTGLVLLRGSQLTPIVSPLDSIAIDNPGSVVLLNTGNDGLKLGASWQAGYIGAIGQSMPFSFTARVVDHLDSLILPLTPPHAPQKDVFVVRYARETGALQPDPALPYWIVYFGKGIGPILSELLLTDATTGQPKIIRKAVFQPPT